ncbi:DNA polymerase III subunit delta [Stappia sp. F7233]|uniref:DNA polymerase III subunit delta n=1 Tax=Stappia albiluteola TaxID=2758565 RepID=A0A839AKD7_9HYPH|nr:DNA polymerase III subunit delta [Stappia albiluteola]MBA5778919.1 DNA polymerase III subunit delta [Stappia albiluteola]
MVAIKPAEIDRFLARPGETFNLILIYGPDTGLVSERAQAVVASVSEGNADPFSLVKLDAADVAADPSRLIDEALTIPLFGGRRTIWVRDSGGKNLMPAVTPILKEEGETGLVVLEAGDLKKSSPLRKGAETGRRAAAIPCYTDGARELDRLIDEEARLAGLAVSREARQALHELLGADRMASRGELRKLCLYAHGRERIDTKDITAIMGDASAFALDELIDAVAVGDLKTVDHGLERLSASGQRADMIASMALRQFQMLHRLRAAHEKGAPASQVVERASPPIFFRRKEIVTRQIMLWSIVDLDKALDLIADTVREARLNNAHLGEAIVSDCFLKLARVARSRAERR